MQSTEADVTLATQAMKIVITSDVESFQDVAPESAFVQYHNPRDHLAQVLTASPAVTVWVCDGKEAAPELVRQWIETGGGHPRLIVVRDIDHSIRLQHEDRSGLLKCLAYPVVGYDGSHWAESTPGHRENVRWDSARSNISAKLWRRQFCRWIQCRTRRRWYRQLADRRILGEKGISCPPGRRFSGPTNLQRLDALGSHAWRW